VVSKIAANLKISDIMILPDNNRWISVTEKLPEPLQTVWLTDGKGWVTLGCLVESDGGWHWGQSNGVIYAENGGIVSECESEDLDVNYWHELPKMPNKNGEIVSDSKSEHLACDCSNEIKTGTLSIDCCNICGRPDEDWWSKKTRL
jgi:hypothetical protein